jgi:radical SAM-linked protein
MVGLPGEDGSDIDGVVSMVRSVESICRVYGRRRKITVSLSPFVPRPHTPFQWEAQERPEEVLKRIRHIRKSLPGGRVRLKWRDPYMAALEGVLCRGDRGTGRAIYLAWEKGSRFDSWTDSFDFDLWTRCLDEARVDTDRVFRRMAREAPLPWEFIGNTVTRDFLLSEAGRADRRELTPDCKTGPCTGCGACPGKQPEEDMAPVGAASGRGVPAVSGGQEPHEVRIRYRVKYAKTEDMRFTSHLDVVRCIQRAFRRADLPVSYSSGYTPHPRISFGPPLPLGVVGEGEFFDVLFFRDPTGVWVDRVNRYLPDGLRLLKARLIALQGSSLMKYLNAADYRIEVHGEGETGVGDILAEAGRALRSDDSVLSVKLTDDGETPGLDLSIRLKQGAARPERVVERVVAGTDIYIKTARRSLYRENQGVLESPFGTPVKEE